MTDAVNFNRVTGLASGMDIEGMVKKLMTAEKVPLNKIAAQKTKLTWKQEAVRSLNLDIKSFIDNTQSMRLQSTFGIFNTVSSDATVVTAKGTPSGSESVVKFNSITALATSASTSTSIAGGLDGNVATQINPDALLNATTFATAPAATGTFTINALQKDGTYKSKTISYDTSVDTLNAVLGRINSAGIGVTAFYDKGADSVVMSTNATGKGTTGVSLQLTDNTGNLLIGTLGLVNSDGTDAAFTMNGVSTTRQSNTFTVNGIEYSLLKTTATTVTVEAKRDVDGIITKIKDFVDKYNTMLSKMNTKVNEPVYRNYQPLTEEQKAAMKDTDIVNWETKAKSGLLSRDMTLQQAINGLRTDAYSTVQGLPAGALNQLNSIGITTGAYTDNGKLVIDETKLRNALTKNPDQVIAVFTNYNATDSTQNGIAWKLYKRANDTINKFTKMAGSGTSVYDSSQFGKDLTKFQTQIDQWNVKLANKENAYYKKFTAMETALNRLQQQSSNLISKMGG
ncbi:flagellar filament capping protein FliD [Paenibacillus alginolyticus]|uniref:Flagellar hook-associated protein 2 n=1 Tax=Paenibacillus alginolyticus TaxID=59839 RepID=A0ABT4GJ32_9BACL|nr:flagellar filament capping protein FliD [Paenibacillus alginolyticus]MCY9696126.1 flagellar filament capping protein FliD [Paenibacillus alginolyticus]MEC0143012.1 flagellar filament capping protein FliD [Paenibacillus alginolyticus]